MTAENDSLAGLFVPLPTASNKSNLKCCCDGNSQQESLQTFLLSRKARFISVLILSIGIFILELRIISYKFIYFVTSFNWNL